LGVSTSGVPLEAFKLAIPQKLTIVVGNEAAHPFVFSGTAFTQILMSNEEIRRSCTAARVLVHLFC